MGNEGRKKYFKTKDSIQWVIDQLSKSGIQEVKPEGEGSINYDKNLGDKHLVWCEKCGNVWDRVYGDLYPDFPKYGKERKDHEKNCGWFAGKRV
jgi:hypothetical protein